VFLAARQRDSSPSAPGHRLIEWVCEATYDRCRVASGPCSPGPNPCLCTGAHALRQHA